MSEWLRSGGVFPPPGDIPRLRRYQQAAHLYEGRHQKSFDAKRIAEKLRDLNSAYGGVSSGWGGMSPEGVIYLVFNLRRLMAQKFADLQVIQQPLILMEDKAGEEVLRQELREDVPDMWARIHNALERKRAFGDALLLIVREPEDAPTRAGAIDLRLADPSRWFPVMSANDPLSATAHQLAWVETVGSGKDERSVLRVDIAYIGRIDRAAFELQPALAPDKMHRTLGPWEIKDSIELGKLWPGLRPEETADIEDFPVIHLPNGQRDLYEPYGRGDFEDSGGLFDNLNWRLSTWSDANDKVSQMARVMPISYIKQDPVSGRSSAPTRYTDVFFQQAVGSDANEIPRYVETGFSAYVSLQAELQDALTMTLVRHEMAPALLGLNFGNQLESGLAKALGMGTTGVAAERDLLQTRPQINRALTVAARLLGHDDEVSTFWRVGLPQSNEEKRAEVKELLNVGLITKREALERIYPELTAAQIEQKLQALAVETREKMDLFQERSAFTAQTG